MNGKQMAFIAGGGRYGSGALEYFLKEKSNWKVLVCDQDDLCQASPLVKRRAELSQLGGALQGEDPTLLVGDAAESMVHLFSRGILPTLVIPSVPFHFAAKVLTAYLTAQGLSVEPYFESLKQAFEKARLAEVEYKLNRENALAVASKMPFNLRCASGCIQPQRCPVTNRKLDAPMYELMAETLSHAQVDISRVLVSRLLAPNVGGYLGKELKQVLDLCINKQPCTIAIATSCSCHAAANMFRIGK